MAVETRERVGQWDGDDGYVEEPPRSRPFGYLMMLDLYHCNQAYLGDIRRAYAFLEALAHALRMTKQSPPFVFLSPPEFADKVGISGWLPLIESGIQIHTVIGQRFVSVDIYCCRRFDQNKAREIAKLFFSPLEIEINEIERGSKYGSV